MTEAKKLDQADEVLELTISYEERGKEKGRELGIQEGKELGIQEGKELGIEEGKELGIKEGKKVGLQHGKELERKEIALSMLKKGYEVEDVHELTQLSIERIHELKEEL